MLTLAQSSTVASGPRAAAIANISSADIHSITRFFSRRRSFYFSIGSYAESNSIYRSLWQGLQRLYVRNVNRVNIIKY